MKQDDNDIELIYVNLKINEQESLFAKASVYLSLCLYRNQIINYFLSLELAAVCLVASGDEEVGGAEIRVSKHNYKQIKLFISLIKPFIFNYSIVYKMILNKKMSRFDNEKNFYKKLQEYAFDEITRVGEQGKIFDFEFTYELLSLNLLTNSILVLKNFAILRKNFNEFEIDLEKLNIVCSLIIE